MRKSNGSARKWPVHIELKLEDIVQIFDERLYYYSKQVNGDDQKHSYSSPILSITILWLVLGITPLQKMIMVGLRWKWNTSDCKRRMQC